MRGDGLQTKGHFGTYFVISVLGFALDTALLNALLTAGGLGGAWSSIGAKAISATSSSFLMFLAHRRWSYRGEHASFLSELARYALVRGSAIGLGVALFAAFHYLLWRLLADVASVRAAILWSANAAQAATGAVLLVLSYVAHRYFTFRRALASRRGRSDDGAEPQGIG